MASNGDRLIMVHHCFPTLFYPNILDIYMIFPFVQKKFHNMRYPGTSMWLSNCVYLKYWDTLTPYHTWPKIWMSPILPLDTSINYWMSGKQCRPWSDATFCGIRSGSALFAEACLSQYLGLLWYMFIHSFRQDKLFIFSYFSMLQDLLGSCQWDKSNEYLQQALFSRSKKNVFI